MVTRLEFCLGQLLPPFPGGLWMASQHHEGIQRLLVLLAGVPVYSVLFGPLLNPWVCPMLLSGTPILEPKPWVVNNSVLCRHLHPFTRPPHCLPSLCLPFTSLSFALPGGQTSILSLYFRVSHSPLRLEILLASLVKVTLFAKSGGALEI